MPATLRIRELTIGFPAGRGEALAVRRLSLDLAPGEIVGLVGESGAGKSLSALAVLGLVPPPGRIRAGSIALGDRELVGLDERSLRPIRGGRVGFVFQEPSAALNPVLPIGVQIVEAMRAHRDLSVAEARRRAVALLERLAMPDAERRLAACPHELSGGQRQRAMLAVALAAEPDFLLADEPTSSLDVTIQAQVLDLLEDLRRDIGIGILLVTHDFGVVARCCDRVAVLYAGEIVEQGTTAEVLRAPAHPYTRGLLAAIPRPGEVPANGRLRVVSGASPPLAERPTGCAFHPRCDRRLAECAVAEPPWVPLGAGRGARCVLPARGATAG